MSRSSADDSTLLVLPAKDVSVSITPKSAVLVSFLGRADLKALVLLISLGTFGPGMLKFYSLLLLIAFFSL